LLCPRIVTQQSLLFSLLMILGGTEGNSAVAIRSLFCPWKCFRLSYERCSPLSFFGDRSSVLFSPPTHLQTSSIIILLLLSIQVDQSSRASIASSIQQHVHRWHHLSHHRPIRFVSSHFRSACNGGVIDGAKTNSGFWWRTEILSDHQLVLRTVCERVA
jgi:hypothetical protein